jgi:hypothetical protein
MKTVALDLLHVEQFRSYLQEYNVDCNYRDQTNACALSTAYVKGTIQVFFSALQYGIDGLILIRLANNIMHEKRVATPTLVRVW